MSPRGFILPSGRAVRAGAYARAWRTLRTLPGDALERSFGHFPERADSILREIRRGLHDRISSEMPGYGRGRKWDQDWQHEIYLASRNLNYPRLVIDWLPPDLKQRFAHRLRENME